MIVILRGAGERMAFAAPCLASASGIISAGRQKIRLSAHIVAKKEGNKPDEWGEFCTRKFLDEMGWGERDA
jgi:hypothetical protein